MEDQVAKLKSSASRSREFIVAAAGKLRARLASDYLEGKLQFLYIAPERLRVTGFPEMLAKRKPTLIAVDEGALHFAVGTRFSSRLPDAWPAFACCCGPRR